MRISINKLPEANVPLRALEGWVTREDLLSVGVRSMRFGKIRFELVSRRHASAVADILTRS